MRQTSSPSEDSLAVFTRRAEQRDMLTRSYRRATVTHQPATHKTLAETMEENGSLSASVSGLTVSHVAGTDHQHDKDPSEGELDLLTEIVASLKSDTVGNGDLMEEIVKELSDPKETPTPVAGSEEDRVDATQDERGSKDKEMSGSGSLITESEDLSTSSVPKVVSVVGDMGEVQEDLVEQTSAVTVQKEEVDEELLAAMETPAYKFITRPDLYSFLRNGADKVCTYMYKYIHMCNILYSGNFSRDKISVDFANCMTSAKLLSAKFLQDNAAPIDASQISLYTLCS